MVNVEEKDLLVLAIETSCDETSAAVVRGGTEVLSNVVSSQIDMHAVFGGVVPEIASRAHLEMFEPVVAQALTEAEISGTDLDAVAATRGPGLIGALLVGVSAAKALAMAWNVPYVGVNHMEGHLFAAFLERPDLEMPAVILLVSGGHTQIVEMVERGNYRYLGTTVDDAAGEAYDKVARYLGLGYPGGPIIDRLAQKGDPGTVRFPRAMKDSNGFSFSGLKTAVVNYVRANPDVADADIAASFQEAVVDVLATKTFAAAKNVDAKTVCLGGGVAANSHLRKRFTAQGKAEGRTVLVPSVEFCTDNAAMIAAAAHWRLLADGPTSLATGAAPSLKLT